MLSKNTVSVYETQTFNLLEKNMYHVVDMCWSPVERASRASFWSPRGRGKHIVLAELKEVSQFEFFDVDKLVTLNKVEHLMATDIAWDTTGRYFIHLATPILVSDGRSQKE